MKIVIGLFIGILVTFQSTAQSTKTYAIDADVPDKKIYSGHLRLGGANPNGEKIAVNNFYLAIGSKPVIPIAGIKHSLNSKFNYFFSSCRY